MTGRANGAGRRMLDERRRERTGLVQGTVHLHFWTSFNISFWKPLQLTCRQHLSHCTTSADSVLHQNPKQGLVTFGCEAPWPPLSTVLAASWLISKHSGQRLTAPLRCKSDFGSLEQLLSPASERAGGHH